MTPAERHLLAALANGLTVALLDRSDLPACRAAEQRLREAVHGWDAEGYAVPGGDEPDRVAVADPTCPDCDCPPGWEAGCSLGSCNRRRRFGLFRRVAGGVAADSASGVTGGAQGAPDTRWRRWEVEEPPMGGSVWVWRAGWTYLLRRRSRSYGIGPPGLWWHPACDTEPTTRPPL